jgi:hypothetical protein
MLLNDISRVNIAFLTLPDITHDAKEHHSEAREIVFDNDFHLCFNLHVCLAVVNN